MTLKGIFFDHDGTLVNSEIEHFRCWRNALRKYDIELSEQFYIDHYVGIPEAKNAEMVINDFGLPVAAADLALEKRAITEAFLLDNIFPILPGVRETIEYFHKFPLKLAVVSGAVETRVMSSLNGHQLTPHFDFTCSADEVTANKPDPAVYQLALTKSGLAVHECLAIEDTEVGMLSALAAGLACCVVRNEYTVRHDFSRATVVVDSMEEARRWIISNYKLPPAV